MNLTYPACLLASVTVVSVLAFLWERRPRRNAEIVRLPDRSNVTKLHRRGTATVIRIDSGRGPAA
jgi:hypothetical protein